MAECISPLAPPTRFQGQATHSEADPDGDVPPSAIHWQQIALHEPEHVAQWLVVLHGRQDPQVLDLLTAVDALMGRESSRPSHWLVYARTGLPYEIIRILCESDVISGERGEDAFKVSPSCRIVEPGIDGSWLLLERRVRHEASETATHVPHILVR